VEAAIVTRSAAAAERVFELESPAEAQSLWDGLQSLLPCRAHPPHDERLLALDTFDGRLARAGTVLCCAVDEAGARLTLSRPDADHDEEATLPAPPAFASDLPAHLREALADLIDVRRLLPVLEIERRQRRCDVRDDDRKIVARVSLVGGSVRALPLLGAPAGGAPGAEPLTALLAVSGVRGYRDALQQVLAVVESRPGLSLSADGQRERLAARVLEALPHEPPAPGADLLPGMPAAEAMRRVQRVLRAALLFHEPGVRLDVDSEFLHDLRVAVRRARSLLGQVKRVFPEAVARPLRTELSWLGRSTGPLRDLDVFLLALDEPDLVEDDDRPALSPLFEHLRALRRAEQARVVAELEAPRYRGLVADWEAFVEALPPVSDEAARAGAHGDKQARKRAKAEGVDRAGQPVARVIARRVSRLHRRICKRARALDVDAPDTAFHAVRIEAKKMRYLLDCARPALDEQHAKPVVAALKRLQAVLGAVQDAHVQRRLVIEAAAAPASVSTVAAGTLVALGRLDERLRARSLSARAHFAARLADFAGDELREHVRGLKQAARPLRPASPPAAGGVPAPSALEAAEAGEAGPAGEQPMGDAPGSTAPAGAAVEAPPAAELRRNGHGLPEASEILGAYEGGPAPARPGLTPNDPAP
jgi:CHAD domain-containing protein